MLIAGVVMLQAESCKASNSALNDAHLGRRCLPLFAIFPCELSDGAVSFERHACRGAGMPTASRGESHL